MKGKATERRIAEHSQVLCPRSRVHVQMDVDTLRFWLDIMRGGCFVEKMNTFCRLIRSPVGWLGFGLTKGKHFAVRPRINSDDLPRSRIKIVQKHHPQ